jgi:nicotinamidase-related amidase
MLPSSKENAMSLVTPRRALVVIDVQNEYVTGNLPIEYSGDRLVLPKVGHAMDAARAHGIPVVVVQNTAPAGAPIFVKGTPGWELHPVVASRPRDHYVEKSLPSAFAGTGPWRSGSRLVASTTLAVIGYMTHNCVDSTIKHALHSGIAVEYMQEPRAPFPTPTVPASPLRARSTTLSAWCCSRASRLCFQPRSGCALSAARRRRSATRSSPRTSVRESQCPPLASQRKSLTTRELTLETAMEFIGIASRGGAM